MGCSCDLWAMAKRLTILAIAVSSTIAPLDCEMISLVVPVHSSFPCAMFPTTLAATRAFHLEKRPYRVSSSYMVPELTSRTSVWRLYGILLKCRIPLAAPGMPTISQTVNRTSLTPRILSRGIALEAPSLVPYPMLQQDVLSTSRSGRSLYFGISNLLCGKHDAELVKQ